MEKIKKIPKVPSSAEIGRRSIYFAQKDIKTLMFQDLLYRNKAVDFFLISSYGISIYSL